MLLRTFNIITLCLRISTFKIVIYLVLNIFLQMSKNMFSHSLNYVQKMPKVPNVFSAPSKVTNPNTQNNECHPLMPSSSAAALSFGDSLFKQFAQKTLSI